VIILLLTLPLVDQAICNGQNVTLTATASGVNGSTISSYAWSGSGTIVSPSTASTTVSPIANTTYTMLVTDNFGCTASDNVIVTVNTVPTVNAGNDQTICSNASAMQLTGFTPAGGTWSGSGVSASGIFTPGAVGNYTLTYSYTSPQGCANSDDLIMSVIAPNVINAGSDQLLCHNATPLQLLTGGTWTGSYVTSGGLFTPSVVGDYTLTYTATSGQCQSSDQIIVSVKALPTVNAGTDQAICNGQNVTLTATASGVNGSTISSYAWSGNGVIASPSTASTTATPTTNTTYTMQVMDNVGCSASDNVVVTVYALPVVNAGNDITLCNQPIAHTLAGFSPAGGVWSGANVTPSGTYTPAGTGTFVLTYCYTNPNGCEACDNITVTVNPATMANAGADESVCFGSAAFMLTPGNGGGTWTATPSLTSAGMFTPGSPGSYNCTYSMGSGTCLTSDVKTVFVRALPIINAGTNASICAGSSHNINATVAASGAPFTYSWSNASTLSANNTEDVVATPTVTTTYGFTVTNTYNCSSTDDITVTVVPLAVPSFSTASTGCVNTNIPVTNTSTGASSYSWNFGNATTSAAANPNTNYTSAGAYTITLTANNSLGCPTVATQPITIITAPVAQFAIGSELYQ
jgi:large repetitive protein